MPEERDIEKSLRAWAKRRREDAGAPIELDPATRRLLQAEVSRLKGGRHQDRSAFAWLLWGSPLRLAVNLTTAAAVLVAGVLLVPRLWRTASPVASPTQQLAQVDRKLGEDFKLNGPVAAKDESKTPPAQTAAEPMPDASKKTAAETAPASGTAVSLAYNRGALEVPAPQPAAMPATPPVSNQEKAALSKGIVFSSVPIVTNSLDGALAAQKFFRLRTPAGAATLADRSDLNPASSAVLDSFQFEQTGGQLRVIDADGSVYTGSLVAADDKLNLDAAAQLSAPTRSFRVTGTNVTRNQPVVFTGSLVFDYQPLPQAPTVAGGIAGVARNRAGGGGGGGFGGGAAARAALSTNAPAFATGAATAATAASAPMTPATPPTSFNFRIQGRALIGTNEIEINAVPARP